MGKVALVTGAARGIGRGIAERFAGEGYTVAICDLADDIEAVAGEIAEAYEVDVLGVVTDVTSPQSVDALFSRIDERFGGVDVLVNNAGIITISRLADLDFEEWNRVLAVNTTGAFLCAQRAIASMRSRGVGGRIITAASGQARQGFIYTPHYAASKFGVVGLTQSLAKEVARDAITVNAYCPGIVGTDMWGYNDREWGRLLGEDAGRSYASGELQQQWIDEIPIRRAGTVDDVANLVLFLASDGAGYITGQAINVDGGMFMN
jgi:meso-butanediol dehydrogenase/(S,S)-butanediol dehydrogenase/diacetyl reductase